MRRMRLMTYNILTGGLDGLDSSRWSLIVGLIREAKPDILVLNECNHFELERNRNFHRMERETDMHGILAPAETGFHVAIFARNAHFIESRNTSHSFHHAMLETLIWWQGHEIRVVGVHMCPFGGISRAQEAEYLTRFSKEDEWVFVAGDMNSISPRDVSRVNMDGWAQRRKSRHLVPGTLDVDTRAMCILEGSGLVDLGAKAGINDVPTVLTPLRSDHDTYRLRIDYVFGNQRVAERLQSARVLTGDASNRASDHYPVIVDVDLETGRSAS